MTFKYNFLAGILIIVFGFSMAFSSKYFLSALMGPFSSNSYIMVKFKSNPNFQTNSLVSQLLEGSPRISASFNSINNLNKKYSTQGFVQMFLQAKSFPNVYELTVKTSNINATVFDFKNDPNVEYARAFDSNLEQKVTAEVNTINQKIAQQHFNWTAGYTIPEIMTDQDRAQLVGVVSNEAGRGDPINDIKALVFQQKPVSASMTVYNDFFAYTGGIYQSTDTNTATGSDAIAIVGYGVDANNKIYWMAKNSWGQNWGEAGSFRIYAANSNIEIGQ